MNITEFTIAKADSGPYDIAAAKDGNIWFTQYKANQISCINKNGEIKEYEVPTPNAKLMCLTVSSSGDIWFTENAANKIGKLTTAGNFTEYLLPYPDSEPYGIAEGLNGDIWFTEWGQIKLVRFRLQMER